MRLLTIILLSAVKCSSCVIQERNMHRSSTVYKQKIVQNSSKQICWWILMQEDNKGWTFSLDEVLLWIMEYFGRKQGLKLKQYNDGFLTNMQLFTSQDVNWWTGVVWITCGLLWCFYQLFGLSFWRHPFTAEDPLVSKWCNATFLEICSDETTNSSTSWMAWQWVHFYFWLNYCFKLFFYLIANMWEWNEGFLCLRLWALKQHGLNMKGLTLIVIFHSISICLCIWFDDTGDRGSFCSPLTEGRTPVPMGPGDPPPSPDYPHLVNLLTSLTSPLSCWPF